MTLRLSHSPLAAFMAAFVLVGGICAALAQEPSSDQRSEPALSDAIPADCQPGLRLRRVLVGVLDDMGFDGVSLDGFMRLRGFVFDRFDADGDGTVTSEEIEDLLQRRVAIMSARIMSCFDINGDGLVSREEFDEVGRARFASRDADADGVIGPSERPAWLRP